MHSVDIRAHQDSDNVEYVVQRPRDGTSGRREYVSCGDYVRLAKICTAAHPICVAIPAANTSNVPDSRTTDFVTDQSLEAQ